METAVAVINDAAMKQVGADFLAHAGGGQHLAFDAGRLPQRVQLPRHGVIVGRQQGAAKPPAAPEPAVDLLLG